MARTRAEQIEEENKAARAERKRNKDRLAERSSERKAVPELTAEQEIMMPSSVDTRVDYNDRPKNACDISIKALLANQQQQQEQEQEQEEQEQEQEQQQEQLQLQMHLQTTENLSDNTGTDLHLTTHHGYSDLINVQAAAATRHYEGGLSYHDEVRVIEIVKRETQRGVDTLDTVDRIKECLKKIAGTHYVTQRGSIGYVTTRFVEFLAKYILSDPRNKKGGDLFSGFVLADMPNDFCLKATTGYNHTEYTRFGTVETSESSRLVLDYVPGYKNKKTSVMAPRFRKKAAPCEIKGTPAQFNVHLEDEEKVFEKFCHRIDASWDVILEYASKCRWNESLTSRPGEQSAAYRAIVNRFKPIMLYAYKVNREWLKKTIWMNRPAKEFLADFKQGIKEQYENDMKQQRELFFQLMRGENQDCEQEENKGLAERLIAKHEKLFELPEWKDGQKYCEIICSEMYAHLFDVLFLAGCEGLEVILDAIQKIYDKYPDDIDKKAFFKFKETFLLKSTNWWEDFIIRKESRYALEQLPNFTEGQQIWWDSLTEKHLDACGSIDLADSMESFEYFCNRFKELAVRAKSIREGTDELLSLKLFSLNVIQTTGHMGVMLRRMLIILRPGGPRDFDEQCTEVPFLNLTTNDILIPSLENNFWFMSRGMFRPGEYQKHPTILQRERTETNLTLSLNELATFTWLAVSGNPPRYYPVEGTAMKYMGQRRHAASNESYYKALSQIEGFRFDYALHADDYYLPTNIKNYLIFILIVTTTHMKGKKDNPEHYVWYLLRQIGSLPHGKYSYKDHVRELYFLLENCSKEVIPDSDEPERKMVEEKKEQKETAPKETLKEAAPTEPPKVELKTVAADVKTSEPKVVSTSALDTVSADSILKALESFNELTNSGESKDEKQKEKKDDAKKEADKKIEEMLDFTPKPRPKEVNTVWITLKEITAIGQYLVDLNKDVLSHLKILNIMGVAREIDQYVFQYKTNFVKHFIERQSNSGGLSAYEFYKCISKLGLEYADKDKRDPLWIQKLLRIFALISRGELLEGLFNFSKIQDLLHALEKFKNKHFQSAYEQLVDVFSVCMIADAERPRPNLDQVIKFIDKLTEDLAQAGSFQQFVRNRLREELNFKFDPLDCCPVPPKPFKSTDVLDHLIKKAKGLGKSLDEKMVKTSPDVIQYIVSEFTKRDPKTNRLLFQEIKAANDYVKVLAQALVREEVDRFADRKTESGSLLCAIVENTYYPDAYNVAFAKKCDEVTSLRESTKRAKEKTEEVDKKLVELAVIVQQSLKPLELYRAQVVMLVDTFKNSIQPKWKEAAVKQILQKIQKMGNSPFRTIEYLNHVLKEIAQNTSTAEFPHSIFDMYFEPEHGKPVDLHFLCMADILSVKKIPLELRVRLLKLNFKFALINLNSTPFFKFILTNYEKLSPVFIKLLDLIEVQARYSPDFFAATLDFLALLLEINSEYFIKHVMSLLFKKPDDYLSLIQKFLKIPFTPVLVGEIELEQKEPEKPKKELTVFPHSALNSVVERKQESKEEDLSVADLKSIDNPKESKKSREPEKPKNFQPRLDRRTMILLLLFNGSNHETFDKKKIEDLIEFLQKEDDDTLQDLLDKRPLPTITTLLVAMSKGSCRKFLDMPDAPDFDFRRLNDQFDTSVVIEKIKAMRYMRTHTPLPIDEQQTLFERFMMINEYGRNAESFPIYIRKHDETNAKKFKNAKQKISIGGGSISLFEHYDDHADIMREKSKALAAKDMTEAEMKEVVVRCRQLFLAPDSTEAAKENAKLIFIALLREAIWRCARKFPFSTQMIAVITAAFAKGNIFEQIPTGGGKSMIFAMKAENLWFENNGAVVIATADEQLAREIFEGFSTSFDMLGIPRAKKVLTEDMTPEEFCWNGINVASVKSYNLFVSKLKINPYFLKHHQHTPISLALDEGDKPILDDKTEYRKAVRARENVKLKWVYEPIYDFVHSEQYKAAQTVSDVLAGIKEKLLIAANGTEDPDKYKRLINESFISDWQIKIWYERALAVKGFIEGKHYEKCIETRGKGDLAKTVYYARIIDKNENVVAERTQLGSSTQQFLHVHLNKMLPKDGPQFLIEEESVPISTITSPGMLDFHSSPDEKEFKRGRINAASGGAGAHSELEHGNRRHGFEYISIPSHKNENRIREETVFARGEKAHFDAQIENILRRYKATEESPFISFFRKIGILDQKEEVPPQPVLIKYDDNIKAKRFHEYLRKQVQTDPRFEPYRKYIYTQLAISGETQINGVVKKVEETELISRAGVAGTITITTRFDRGYDIKPRMKLEDPEQNHPFGLFVMCTSILSVRLLLQVFGRAARLGWIGFNQLVLDQNELDVNKVAYPTGNPQTVIEKVQHKKEKKEEYERILSSRCRLVKDYFFEKFALLFADEKHFKLEMNTSWGACLNDIDHEWNRMIDLNKREGVSVEQLASESMPEFIKNVCKTWNNFVPEEYREQPDNVEPEIAARSELDKKTDLPEAPGAVSLTEKDICLPLKYAHHSPLLITMPDGEQDKDVQAVIRESRLQAVLSRCSQLFEAGKEIKAKYNGEEDKRNLIPEKSIQQSAKKYIEKAWSKGESIKLTMNSLVSILTWGDDPALTKHFHVAVYRAVSDLLEKTYEDKRKIHGLSNMTIGFAKNENKEVEIQSKLSAQKKFLERELKQTCDDKEKAKSETGVTAYIVNNLFAPVYSLVMGDKEKLLKSMIDLIDEVMILQKDESYLDAEWELESSVPEEANGVDDVATRVGFGF